MTTANNISQEIAEELKYLSPALARIKKENIFNVPHGYFEELPAKIKEQCKEDDLYKANNGVLRYINLRSVAAAASVLLIAVSLLVYNIKDSNQQLALQEFTSEEILDYLDAENVYDMNEEYLIEELSSMDNVVMIEESIETVEIIDYLLENDIDLTTIINEIN